MLSWYRCNGKSSEWGTGCQNDRVEQTVDGVTTRYVLDSVSPLTQVLQDGSNSYLYGMERISQIEVGTPEYFLTDGLGSVRQLVDENGSVTLSNNYQPFGEAINNSGASFSSYGFAGERVDHTNLIYLRARFYDPLSGRFINKDTWEGNTEEPMSFNRWIYVLNNPITFLDPSGRCRQGDEACLQIAKEIVQEFSSLKINMGVPLSKCDLRIPYIATYWEAEELAEVQRGLRAINNTIISVGGSESSFSEFFGGTVLTRMTKPVPLKHLRGAAGYTSRSKYVVVLDIGANTGEIPRVVIHEFGHIFGVRGPGDFGWYDELLSTTGGTCEGMTKTGSCTYYKPGGTTTEYGKNDLDEDFSDSFYAFVRLWNFNEDFNFPGNIDSERYDFFVDILGTNE